MTTNWRGTAPRPDACSCSPNNKDVRPDAAGCPAAAQSKGYDISTLPPDVFSTTTDNCIKVWGKKSLKDLKHAAKARGTIQACTHRSTTNDACNARKSPQGHNKELFPSNAAPRIMDIDQRPGQRELTEFRCRQSNVKARGTFSSHMHASIPGWHPAVLLYYTTGPQSTGGLAI